MWIRFWDEVNMKPELRHHLKITIQLTFSQNDAIPSGMKEFKMMKLRG
jgi:hypothetical protein